MIEGMYKLGSAALHRFPEEEVKRRRQYLNASEVYTCLRRLGYDRTVPRPDPVSGFAIRGHSVERHAIEALREHTKVWAALEDQQPVTDGMLSATPDGYIEIDGKTVQVEIKSFDPRTARSKLPRAEHVAQVQIGMALASPQVELGVLLYINASDYLDIIEFEVLPSDDAHDTAARRAQEMFRAVDDDNVEALPAEGALGGSECSRCPYADICTRTGFADLTRPAGGNRVLIDAAERFIERKAAADDAKAEADKARADLIVEADTAGVKAVDTDSGTVVITERAGGRSLDWAAAEGAGIDLSPYTRTGRPVQIVTVKKD